MRNLFTRAVMVFIDPNNTVVTIETEDSHGTQELPSVIKEWNNPLPASMDRADEGLGASGSYWLVIIVAGVLLVIVVAVIINKVW